MNETGGGGGRTKKREKKKLWKLKEIKTKMKRNVIRRRNPLMTMLITTHTHTKNTIFVRTISLITSYKHTHTQTHRVHGNNDLFAPFSI